MTDKKIISFRLWGDYALYKKPWCNREQQSFLIPTKTAITGMIGGIMGYGKREYLDKIPPNDIKLGIKLNKKISKELHGYNFMQSENIKEQTKKFSNPYRKDSVDNPNSRTRLEMLKNPDYNIYLDIKDSNTQEKLFRHLENGEYVFPPFLGQVNMFANISEVKRINLKEKNINKVETVAPSEIVDGSEIDGVIYNQRIPVSMDKDRSKPEYMSIAVKNKENSKIKIEGTEKFLRGLTSDGSRVVLF